MGSSDIALSSVVPALARGELRPEGLVDRAIARHDGGGLRLNAYVVWDPDRARARAAALSAPTGPLWGVPVSVKDLYGVAGWPTHAGMRDRLPAEWETEGPLVRRLCRQGAVLVGKTHTVELAFGGLGTNPHWPVPRNPWDAREARVPGGSSSGAGVSLAEGSALLALGTDTAGSVRVPASFTGQVGVKTSPGRWPTAGIVTLSPTLDTAGLLARSVVDARIGFAALDGEEPRGPAAAAEVGSLRGMRIGRLEPLLWDGLDPGIGEALETALGELSRVGAHIERVELAEVSEALELFFAGGPVAAELAAFLEQELPGRRPGIDPNVAGRLAGADELTAVEYLGRLHRMARLRRAAAASVEGIDLLAAPTVAITPPTLAELADPKTYRRRNAAALRNTAALSYLGACAVSLPVGLDRAGMPVGLQLARLGGDDERLLELAAAAEGVLGAPADRLGPPPGLRAAPERPR
jgi:aspartyl-tRNA(Asn)/glutamyl-tRNA(Gln) amidotransferase subunit A